MTFNVGEQPLSDLYASLRNAKESANNTKVKETTSKEKVDSLTADIQNGTGKGGEARRAAVLAIITMQAAYNTYSATFKPYEDAKAKLSAILAQNPPAADNDIANAKAALNSAENARNEAYNRYIAAQKEWEEKDAAADKAEGEDSVELEQAITEHGENVEASKAAEEEVNIAERAITDAKENLIKEGYEIDSEGTITKTPVAEETEEIDDVNNNVALMSEEEAVKQGYTIIKSYEDLIKIGENLNGKYILMGNIDIPEGINWTPIGNIDSPFTGEFNGNGCNITGLNITVENDDAENIGFLGVTENAVIKNVNIVDAKVNGKSDLLTGTSNIGILAGLAKSTAFDNINVSGEVTGAIAAGGLIGAVDDRGSLDVNSGNSIITNCTTDVTVNSQYYAGGLVGYVYGTDAYRNEDHRGVATKSLIIRDCKTSGIAVAGEESVGGIIGECGKTLVTLDRCTSSMYLTWSNLEDDSDLSFLLETGRIGGLVGNINGSYITFANCSFDGSLNGDTEFQSEMYGWYMDDAHVSIYDLPAGLPVDDILNINGIDGMKQIGNNKFECTVSTLSGLDKMVSMIKAKPELAEQIVFIVNFDFNAMDGEYDYSDYVQYGIVQHLHEDEEGNVHNDVYIDNECDLESTYHSLNLPTVECQNKCNDCEPIYHTMVPGLWKDDDGNYLVLDDYGVGHQVALDVRAENQITDIRKRLTSSEVKFRERLVEMGKAIQEQMRSSLKTIFNWHEEEPIPILTKAEYKKLIKKAQKYGFNSLTDKEKLGMAVFEVDYDIMNAQAKYTKNLGCGMGGNASFLDKTTTYQMYDEQGRALFTNLDGEQLVGIYSEDGEITGYRYADSGEPFYGMGDIYEQRGYQNTDENGNLLYTHTAEDGTQSTVTQITGEDGTVSYVTTNENGEQVPFEGDVNSLERQLTPANYADDYSNFKSDLEDILQDVKDGKYPKGLDIEDDTETETDKAAEEDNDTGRIENEEKKKEADEDIEDEAA